MDLIASIEPIIREAGQIMRGAHLAREEIIQKSGHQNFVTEYDKKVQVFLEEQLHKLLPEAAFFGEEDEEHDDALLSSGDVFVIDPIDGTSNFMKGFFPSCISIGMSRRKPSGVTTARLPHCPTAPSSWWALAISVRPIRGWSRPWAQKSSVSSGARPIRRSAWMNWS